MVSYEECIASWGIPTSTACMLTWIFERFPKVDPPAESLRLAKVWKGTLAFAQMPSKTARLKASVVYFWLDDSFTTMPLFRSGLLRSSAFSGWLGCSAWALSQLTRKEDAWARRKPS